MPDFLPSPQATFNQIKGNLTDRYASGFPVLKELIQNAEDAEAAIIRFQSHPGWPEAANPLLRVPGLIVVNDGRFTVHDGEGIMSFADSRKGGDVASIGRFGVGQKAVFHLCDAFIVHAFGHGIPFSTVANPCLNVIEDSRAKEWEVLGTPDIELLEAQVADLPRGVLLWLPLRRDEILPAPKLSFTDARPTAKGLIEELGLHATDLCLILAAMRYLDRIEAVEGGKSALDVRRTDGSVRMVGPSSDNAAFTTLPRRFAGQIRTEDGKTLQYIGAEVLGTAPRLIALKDGPDWPQVPVFTAQGREIRPEKAEPHGAVIMVGGPTNGPAQLCVDWGVFLPLGKPTCLALSPGTPSLQMMLHGYFFLDSGRRHLLGLAADQPVSGTTIHENWNRALRDELILPLLPELLHSAFSRGLLTSAQLANVVETLRRHAVVLDFRDRAAARHSLVRRVEPATRGNAGIARWDLTHAESNLRPVPAADDRGRVAIVDLLPGIFAFAAARQLVLVAGPEATLTAGPLAWNPSELAALLHDLPFEVFLQGGQTAALVEFLGVAVGQDEARRAAVSAPLLTALRSALGATRALAPDELIRAVLAYLPSDTAIGLPKAAGERPVLRAMAQATGGPLCVRGDWLVEGASRSALTADDAVRLFEALGPLIDDHRYSEPANAAAVCLLGLMRDSLTDAAGAPAFAKLQVLRLGDGGGRPQPVTLSNLVSSARRGLLFRDNPRVREFLRLQATAAPDIGALIVSGPAADLLAEVGDPFTFADTSIVAFCRLLEGAERFGTPEDRRALISKLDSDAAEARAGLRALAAGDPRASAPHVRLVTIDRPDGALDVLATRLIAEAADDFLVPAVVADALPGQRRRQLGIESMDGTRLGHLLTSYTEVLATMELEAATITALLESDVPEQDLAILPIHVARNGRRLAAAQVFRDNPDWSVPAALAVDVPILRAAASAKARRMQERLVAPWSAAAQVMLALDRPSPHRYWREILAAVARDGGVSRAEMLKVSPWLLDRHGRPWAPQDVLDLPNDLLATAGAILVENGSSFLPVIDLLPEQRADPSFTVLNGRKILPDRLSSVEALLMQIEEERPIARFGKADGDYLGAAFALAKAGHDLALPGWPLLAALLRFTANSGGPPAERIMGAFGQVSELETAMATAYLEALARASELQAEGADVAYAHAFRIVCAWPRNDFRSVMAGIRVPTVAGVWKNAKQVVGRIEGPSPDHVLADALRSMLPGADVEERVVRVAVGHGAQPPAIPGQLVEVERSCATSLRTVLADARADVPADLLILLVGIVRQTDTYRETLRHELSVADANIDRIWSRIRDEVDTLYEQRLPGQSLAGLRVKSLLRLQRIVPPSIQVETLSGDLTDLPVGSLDNLLVVGDGHQRRVSLRLDERDFWFRDVLVAGAAGQVSAASVKRLCRKLAQECLGYQPRCLEAMERIAEDCDRTDQTTVEQTRAHIEDQLPHILAELKLPRATAGRRALEEYNRGEGALSVGKSRTDRLADLKRKLWNDVTGDAARKDLLDALRRKIDDYGYRPQSVLFELFQNADDAATQHPSLGEAHFHLELQEGRLRVAHWGRLINHLGADADEGQRNGWERDLINMLLLNLSDKDRGVTGRFGLGFKSAHLLSSDIGLASGFVACRIGGGFLPEVWPEGREVSTMLAQEGRRATVIDIPLEKDSSVAGQQALKSFRNGARWLPAMGRTIRQVEFSGMESGKWGAHFTPTGAPGIEILILSGAEPGYALSLQLSDEVTLFMPLDADGPASAAPEVPRLWLLSPLSESLASGWLVNGRQFKVDPGRGRLAGTEVERHETFGRMGLTLGERLVGLHDLVAKDWAGFARSVSLADVAPETGPSVFWRRLASLFARDLHDPIAQHMHGPDRGYGHLVAERGVLPTGLPYPFHPFLRATDARYVLTGALSDPATLRDLHDWRSAKDLEGTCMASDMAERLVALGFSRLRPFALADLLRTELAQESKIGPETAARLGRLVNRERVNGFPREEEQHLLALAADSRFRTVDGTWREARLPPLAAASGDDALLVAFAPNDVLADPGYSDVALQFWRFARERSGFQQNATTFTDWARRATDISHQRAVLTYVTSGNQGEALGAALAGGRPGWLPSTFDELQNSPLASSLDQAALAILLQRLYPGEHQRRLFSAIGWVVPTGDPDMPPDATAFFQRLELWWRTNSNVHRQRINRVSYPDDFGPGVLRNRTAEEDREGWFTFFALAIFRTIGRTNDGQHRRFVEGARRDGWWGEMATAQLPGDPEPWIGRLEDFARAEAWRIEFPQWRRALADLYLLARWLPDYVEALQALPAVVQTHQQIALSEVFRLSASPLWQRRGLEGGPLTQSLGLGANWLVRESLRHGIWQGNDARAMHPYAWAPTARVRRLLTEQLCLSIDDRSDMDLAPEIYEIVRSHLDDLADFGGDFDLPLQIIADQSWAGELDGLLQATVMDEPDAAEESGPENEEEEEMIG